MFDYFREDVARHARYAGVGKLGRVRLVLTNQCIWATACYRVGHWLQVHRLPPGLHQFVQIFYGCWQKSIEMTTGIFISARADIGPGFYIGHFGCVFIGSETTIGRDFHIAQEVTLGIAGNGENRGMPTVGDRVWIGCGAKVIGKIHLASGTVVGACALVNRSTEENAVLVGIPAKTINHAGSASLIS